MPTSEGLHENESLLEPAAIDRHRALASIGEELEAVDWYDQRAEATSDAELAEVLAHNRDEEKEHAAMTLEWLRRNDPTLDKHLRTYLFTTESIVAEEASTGGACLVPRSEPTHGEAQDGERSGDGVGTTNEQDRGAQDVSSGGSADGSLGIGSLR